MPAIAVTGASQGIGRAIAKSFAQPGNTLWLCDVDAERLEATTAECRSLGAECNSLQLDVTDNQAVGSALGGLAQVDVLVNVAGGVRGQVGRPLEEVSPQDWQALLDVNLTGTFNCVQAVAPQMKRQKHGRVVNISSGAGIRVSLTGIQAYAAAKAGQLGLTRQLAHELGPYGITVNAVAPGFVLSNPTTQAQWERMQETGQQQLVSSLAMRRLGTPEDISNAVQFFASDAASWITGQVLSVDGGRL